MTKPTYTAKDIGLLEGLEPIKHRPGMYTKTEHPGHMTQEVIDNAADEALAGFCSRIDVTVHKDGSYTVADDGRGIPVEDHPIHKLPAVVMVFTKLHSGGKFDKANADSAYRFSGGLHGVGVCVTNALSTRLEVEVTRDGARHRVVFEDGEVVEPLAVAGPAPKKASGTKVRLWPSAKYFDTPVTPIAELERLLRAKAVLLPGLTVTLSVEDKGREEWRYESGMAGYLASALEQEPIGGIFTGEKIVPAGDETYPEGSGAAWALAFTPEGGIQRESYVNLIPTTGGGTHENGLRDAAYQAVKSFAEHHALLPKGIKLAADDVFARLSFVLSAKVLDPSFQGQTKERLNSREAMGLVSKMMRDPLELWLNDHPENGKRIVELAVKAAQARTRAGQKVEKRKQASAVMLPGKLADCASEDIRENELFLVEGDSAGGSAKQGRDKERQAILPLRGKVLNTWEVDPSQLFKNNEVHDIAVACGVDPHGLDADDKVLDNLRYGKIIIMTDADVDGSHIRVLLATLFFRHFPKLVEAGHLYFAQPPLYRVDVAGQGKNKPPRKFYALDEAERSAVLDRLEKEGVKAGNTQISRFKGLGEMNPSQLWETTMSPDTRRLLQVAMPPRDEAQRLIHMLMGKGEAQARRVWMESAEVDPEAV